MKQTLRTVGVIYLLAALTLVLNLSGWLTPPPGVAKLLSEVGIALLAVGTIHLLDHFSLIREVAGTIVSDTRKAFETGLRGATDQMTATLSSSIVKSGEQLEAELQGATNQMTTTLSSAITQSGDQIVGDVNKRTERAFDDASQILQKQIESIKVMAECNLKEIFPSRSVAGESIRAAMAKSNEVWLMGISLNEFCRQEQGPFSVAWDDLIEGIKQGKKKARLLLIDPYCHGATLRAYSETASSATVPDRMETDVLAAANLLHSIRNELGQNRQDLDVRVYRMAPTVFLCHLDNETFVQDYFFWNRRLANTPFPVFHYLRKEDPRATCIHRELSQHFDFIWNHATIRLEGHDTADPNAPASHFLTLPSRGLEWGGHASGVQNVFIDRRRASVRMREEIEFSKRIWIQGITLRAFFDTSDLANVLKNRIREAKDSTDIRIMLLDPECEQAKVRAYREYVLSRRPNDRITLADFTQKHFDRSKLRRDLMDTRERIEELERGCGRQGLLRTYDAAPNMFVLIGDSAAFVEQYTYGKLAEPTQGSQPQRDAEVILGSDMPLIEYGLTIDPIYVRALKNVRDEGQFDEQLRPQPFPLLVDHFEWAWGQAHPQ
jgi:hypothetical protein